MEEMGKFLNNLVSEVEGSDLLQAHRIFNDGVLPFVRRASAGRQNFSLAEVGSTHGLFSLPLAARYPHASLLVLEPNRTIWMDHSSLAMSATQPHVLIVHNNVAEDVAEVCL